MTYIPVTKQEAHEIRLAHEAKYSVKDRAALDAGNKINEQMFRGLAIDNYATKGTADQRDALYAQAYGLDMHGYREMQRSSATVYRAIFAGVRAA